MSLETLALESGIETKVSLESEIAAFSTELTEAVLLIGSNDWFVLPVPNNDLWDVEFDVYFDLATLPETSDSKVLIEFGHSTDDSMIMIELAIPNENNEKLVLYGNSAENNWYDSDDGEGNDEIDIDATGWYHIRFYKSGSEIKCVVIAPDETVKTLTLEDIGADTFDFDLATLCNGRSANYWDPGLKFYDGVKIKKFDRIYKFGTAYTDVAKTSFVAITDAIADIVNKGSLGGDFIQSIADERPTLSSFVAPNNISLAALESGIAEGSQFAHFNGIDAYVNCGDEDEFSFGDGSNDSAFTLMAWINMEDASLFPIICKGGEEYSFYTLGNDVIQFLLWDQSNNANIGRRGTALTAYEGTWLHVAATYDGSKSADGMAIYVNGVINDISDVITGSYVAMENLSSGLFIGKFDYAAAFAGGRIRDAKIFDVELSEADVLTEYQNNNRTSDLVAHYKLYTNVDDSGANEFDGINNNVTFPIISLLSLESSLL